MKKIFILYSFFCLLFAGFQSAGANSNPLSWFDTASCSGQENVLCIDSLDIVWAETILDVAFEDVDSEIGILRKKSRLQIFGVQLFFHSEYIYDGPIGRTLLQHYTNLPPPAGA